MWKLERCYKQPSSQTWHTFIKIPSLFLRNKVLPTETVILTVLVKYLLVSSMNSSVNYIKLCHQSYSLSYQQVYQYSSINVVLKTNSFNTGKLHGEIVGLMLPLINTTSHQDRSLQLSNIKWYLLTVEWLISNLLSLNLQLQMPVTSTKPCSYFVEHKVITLVKHIKF